MTKGLKALEYFYNLVDLQGGTDEYWKNYRIIEKKLKTLDSIKDILKDILSVEEKNNHYYLVINLILYKLYVKKISKAEYKLMKKVLEDE